MGYEESERSLKERAGNEVPCRKEILDAAMAGLSPKDQQLEYVLDRLERRQ